jgi:hypothetical protein
MYFPRNWEFSSALSKLRNFGGGGVESPKSPSVRHLCRSIARPSSGQLFILTEEPDNLLWSNCQRKVKFGSVVWEITNKWTIRKFIIRTYYNHSSCLHFSATCSYVIQHYTIFSNIKCQLFTFLISLNALHNTSFKEQLPEDGHNRWPKYVAVYAVYNTTNWHI